MRRYQIVLLVILIIGAGYVIYEHHKAPFRHCEGKIFGTYYNITYQHEDDLQHDIVTALMTVDNSLSMFNEYSTIGKINRNESTALDAHTTFLIGEALAISETTGGAFDITVAPLVNAWGFGTTDEAPPTAETIDSLLAFVGYDKIAIHGNSLVKSDPRTMLDLSAIAKGYGADIVAQTLDKWKVDNYMIEIGGDIVVKGHGPHSKTAWRIAVQDPSNDDNTQTILTLTNCAVATSGNYRNFHYTADEKVAHTIDPVTGQPIQTDVLSATVIAPKCYLADAYATAAMVLGTTATLDLLSAQDTVDAYLIYALPDGARQVTYTPHCEQYLQQ